MSESDNSNYDKHKPSKGVLEESMKKIKCPVCGFQTEPYYIRFHQCSEDKKSIN
jgi:hypothetical protein